MGTYNNPMGCSRADSSSDGLKSLLHVDDEASINRGRFDPLSVLAEDLKTSDCILRQESEEASRILVRTNSDGARGTLGILD